MSDASNRLKLWSAALDFLRGAAAGSVAVLLAAFARNYIPGGTAPGGPGVAVAIFAILLPAVQLMDRSLRCPREYLAPPLLLLESLAVLAATFCAALVGLLVIPPAFAVGMDLAVMLGPLLLAFGLLGFCPWYAQAVLRRLARRRGWMEWSNDSPATWRDEIAGMAKGTAGRTLINHGCVFGGLLPALHLIGLLAPADWCGGPSFAPFSAAMIMLILANAGAGDPVTPRRVATMTLVGFGGGMAAILTAQSVAGCTGLTEWLGWPREIVEIGAGIVVAFLVFLTHEHFAGDRPDSTSGGPAQDEEDAL